MDTSLYPNLEQWHSQMAAYSDTVALWVAFLGAIAVGLWIIYHRAPKITRLAVLTGLGAATLSAALPHLGNPLQTGWIALFTGYMSWHWIRLFRTRPKAVPAWFVPALIAAVLRLPGLGIESLWYDETFTAGVSRLPYPDMLRVVAGDVHPGYWYELTGLITRLLGSSEWVLRLPAMVFGVLACWLIYRLALRWRLSQTGAVVATLLIAVLPAQLYYSNEARSYTLLMCLVLGMLLAIEENRPAWWAVCAVLALQSHNLAYVYVGIIGLYAAGRFIRSYGLFFLRSRWTLALGIAALSGGLGLPRLVSQGADIADGFWIAPFRVGDAFTPLLSMTIGQRLPASWYMLASGILIVGVCLCIVTFVRSRQQWQLWATVALGVPFALAGISAAWHNVYLERALLPSMALMVIPVAWALTSGDVDMRLRRVGWVALGVVMIPSALSYYDMSKGRVDLSRLDDYCASAQTAYATTLPAGFIGSYYSGKPLYLWPLANDLNQSLPPDSQEALGWPRLPFDQMRGRVCLLDLENALNRADERKYMETILGHPHQTITVAANSIYRFQVHLVDMP